MGRSKLWFIVCRGKRLHRVRPNRRLPMGRSTFEILYLVWRFTLTAKYGRGICVTQRDPWGKHNALPAGRVLKWEWPSMKKRIPKADQAATRHLAAVESELFKDNMALIEHCCLRQYDEGDARETGWITIKTQGAAWIVQVKDYDTAMSFQAVGDSLDKALATANLLLACDEAPWEPDPWIASQKASKAAKKK